jgi:hypothetical protein
MNVDFVELIVCDAAWSANLLPRDGQVRGNMKLNNVG